MRYIFTKKIEKVEFPERLKIFPMDVETANFNGREALDPKTSTISTLQFALPGKSYYIFDVLKGGMPNQLKDILEDPTILKIIHNASFEYVMFLETLGIEIKNIWCTMIGNIVLYNGLNYRNDYGSVVKFNTGVELPKDQGKSDWGKRPLNKKQIKYAFNDVVYLEDIYYKQLIEFLRFRLDPGEEKYLFDRLDGRLTLKRLKKIFPDIMDRPKADIELAFDREMAVLPVFCEMELTGIYFNLDKVRNLKEDYDFRVRDIQTKLQEILPPVELTKSDQNKKWMRELYPDLMKPVSCTNDYKRALKSINVPLPTYYDRVSRTVKETLSKDYIHLLKHESGPLIKQLGAERKLLDSYIDPILGKPSEKGKKAKISWVHPHTNRVHPSIRQHGAVTSRPIFSNPPVQTMPKLKVFRELIEAYGFESSWKILKVDYAQVELRVGAKVTNDWMMMETFRLGRDLHIITAQNVLGIKDVTPDHRQKAKAVNFGLSFDQSAAGFQEYAYNDFGVEFTIEECRQFKKNFLNQYEGFKKYHYKVKNDTLDAAFNGYRYECWGLGGNVRYFDPKDIKLIQKENTRGDKKEHYYTICKDAINFPIQNGNAVMLKEGILYLNNYIKRKKLPAKIILQVHDELVLEYHTSCYQELMIGVIKCLKKPGHYIHPVPLELEIQVGKDWGNTKKVYAG